MNQKPSGDTPAFLWFFWGFAILASPLFPFTMIATHPAWTRPAFLIAYLMILAISLIAMEPRAEARRGSWEWFVETVERGVPLSILGVIASGVVWLGIIIAFVSLYGSG